MSEVSSKIAEVRLLIAGEWQDGAGHAEVLDKYRLAPYARLHQNVNKISSNRVPVAQMTLNSA